MCVCVCVTGASGQEDGHRKATEGVVERRPSRGKAASVATALFHPSCVALFGRLLEVKPSERPMWLGTPRTVQIAQKLVKLHAEKAAWILTEIGATCITRCDGDGSWGLKRPAPLWGLHLWELEEGCKGGRFAI